MIMNNEDISKKIQVLEDRVVKIEERNKKVELNKAWEQSFFRIVFIAILTYVLTSLVFYIIGVSDCFKNALIPTLGFILSVQSVSIFKKKWIVKRLK